ncbi:glycosyltransferase [Chloroflexota bacterium]
MIKRATINETIILLTYLYDYNFEGYNRRFIKLVDNWLGEAYFSFDLYLYKPLQETFSKAIVYDYLKRIIQIGIKAVNEEIINLVRKERPKYVLWASWRYDVLESTLDAIRREGSIVVGWFFDDEWRFDNYSKWWIPHLDYCVTNSIEAVPKYRELGARVIHTIPNTGIAIDRDWSNIEEKYDVSFVGTKIVDRELYINEVKNRNIPIHLFGMGWGTEYIPFEEMIDIFKTSKINLNFSKDLSKTTTQIKGRVFQVCMAGGFMLTEYTPGIEDYFEVGKEVVCFENSEEMIDKITYYLNHDKERRAIAQAGWRRAISEYTSSRMIAKVFHEIENDFAAKGREANPHLQELQMPTWIHKRHSNYYFQLGRILLEENYKDIWREALTLSISHNSFNLRAWYYYITSFFPSPMRLASFRIYRAMEELQVRLLALRHRLVSIPCVRKILQRVINGL